jgi:signal peptidase
MFPGFIGADSSYLVLSGSMKPTLHPGDIIFTKSVNSEELRVGEIVTVEIDSRIFTHRIVNKKISEEGYLIRLKGDANEDPDPSFVHLSDITGKLIFSLPTRYVYTKTGYILIIAAPLLLLSAKQILSICKTYDLKRARRNRLEKFPIGTRTRRKVEKWSLEPTSALLLLIIVAGSIQLISPYYTIMNEAFYSDCEKVSINSMNSATWRVPSSLTCRVSTETLSLGESIIVSGVLDMGRPGVQIKLEYSCNGECTRTNYVETIQGGTFEEIFEPSTVGEWSVIASWEGNHSYYSAKSAAVEFEVLEGVTDG